MVEFLSQNVSTRESGGTAIPSRWSRLRRRDFWLAQQPVRTRRIQPNPVTGETSHQVSTHFARPGTSNLHLSDRYHVAPEGTQALCPGTPETEDNDRRSSQVWSDHYCWHVGVQLVLRYIDLIHQRGQALFNAYNDMRKKLGDVRNEIAIIGRKNHDAEQTIKRFIIVFL